jgi:hypothetical protein
VSDEIRVDSGTVVEFEHGIRVGQYESERDGAHLVWIDTDERTGHIRVELNDALHPLYDGDCETTDDRLTQIRKAFEDSIVEVLDEIEKSRDADDMGPVFEARDAADDLLSSILNRLRKETS